MYTEVQTAAAMGYLATYPTMIITTLHESKIVNAGVFGSYTKLAGNLIGVAVATSSHSYANIVRDGEFVINIPGADIVKTIKVLAAKIGPDRSELDDAGLTAKSGVNIQTPSIAECAAAVEFTVEKEVAIGVHSLIIGKVQGGWIKTELLDNDGKINVFKAKVFKHFKYPQPLYILPGEVIEG